MNTNLSDLARKIIKENQYMTIASSGVKGNAWASTVAYVYDDDFNFYWVSVPESQHQQNIKNRPEISISIFDSHQLWGEGAGVQIEATVHEVPTKDIPKVTKLYFFRDYPYGNARGSFSKGLVDLLKGNIYKFYKAVPKKVWVPDPDADVDVRVEVNLIK